MSMQFDFPGMPEGDGAPRRGAAPVGYLGDLDALERTCILALRGCCGSDDDRIALAGAFRTALGARAGAAALADFASLIGVALAASRHPLMRHGLSCRCFGGDECAFAQLLAAAAVQDHDEAMLFALTLIKAPVAFEVVRMASAFGPAMLRLASALASDAAAFHAPSGRPH